MKKSVGKDKTKPDLGERIGVKSVEKKVEQTKRKGMIEAIKAQNGRGGLI